MIQKYCDQKLDHFDPQNTKTWCQRFLTNATFKKPGGPAFICIDGEDYPWLSGRRPYTMVCNNMVQLAKEFGAIMLAVEHRYYGGADFDGVPDFTTENLKYHTSRQALADLNQFWGWISPQLPASEVVVFGGSYPGSLSAWARKLHPESFRASVASSAPLLAQANFVGYNDVVASALTASSVGGSPECLATYSKGHAELKEMMKTAEGRRAVEKKFNLCGYNPLDDENNIAYWAGQDGIVATIPQYNNANCEHTNCNMKLFCGNLSIMSKSTVSAIDALQLMFDFQNQENARGQPRGQPAPECTDASYAKYVDGMKRTEKVSGTDPKAGDQLRRLWTFQTCNEFGWYQTCESGSNCPYTQGFNTIHWALDICNLLFDMSPGDVLHNIDKTNQFYGGAAYPGATYTVFTNGEVDPWHWESTLVGEDPTVDAIFVKGASHCEWMHAVTPGMPGMLIEAKKAIQNKIASWLPMAAKDTTPEATKQVKPKAETKDPQPAKDAKEKPTKAEMPKANKLNKFLLATESEITSHLQVRTEL